MRRAARRDANEVQLVLLARMLGAHMVKEGPLDYWCEKDGNWTPVEIKVPSKKDKKGEFTDAQLSFFARCKMYGSPWWVWRTDDDVFRDLRPSRKP